MLRISYCVCERWLDRRLLLCVRERRLDGRLLLCVRERRLDGRLLLCVRERRLDRRLLLCVCEKWLDRRLLQAHLNTNYSMSKDNIPPGRLQCCSSLRQNVELSNTSMTPIEPSTRPTSSESIVKPRQPSISPLLCGHASAVTQCGWTSK